MRGGIVPARTFEDSAGTVWEVFEVQRSSRNAQAVSAGLELGWLAFVSGAQKRRLAPFPADWYGAEAAELERLCGLARAARGTGVLAEPQAGDGAQASPDARTRVPRIRPSRTGRTPTATAGELPIAATATNADPVEDTVREFAHQARSRGVPAIEAMVQLKGLLARVYPDPGSVARDLRAVRRWFVEAYYFEREGGPSTSGPPAGAPSADQSR
jgi:hypothetical protein